MSFKFPREPRSRFGPLRRWRAGLVRSVQVIRPQAATALQVERLVDRLVGQPPVRSQDAPGAAGSRVSWGGSRSRRRNSTSRASAESTARQRALGDTHAGVSPAPRRRPGNGGGRRSGRPPATRSTPDGQDPSRHRSGSDPTRSPARTPHAPPTTVVHPASTPSSSRTINRHPTSPVLQSPAETGAQTGRSHFVAYTWVDEHVCNLPSNNRGLLRHQAISSPPSSGLQ